MSGCRRSLGPALGAALAVCVSAVGVARAQESADQAVWEELMRMVRAEKVQRQQAHEQQVHNAGFELGPWSCVGPFRDGDFGLFSRCFARAYGPFSASLVWAYAIPLVNQSQRESKEIVFESFEDPDMKLLERFPTIANQWFGRVFSVAGEDGMPAVRT